MSVDAVARDHPAGAPRRYRVAPVLALLVIAPWAAECSWGGFPASQYPVVVLFLGPLYGGAAILIRETARRTGTGWPGIVLLAAAFGVYQAGLVDQSLFNIAFLDDTQFAGTTDEAAATRVPWLGFSAAQAVDFIGNHIALSICAPIAVVESYLGPQRRREPWLGARGLATVGVMFALGSLLVFSEARKGFLVAPHQAAVAVLAVLGLGVAALLPRWRRTRRLAPGRTPHPFGVAVLSCAVGVADWWVSGWAGVAVQLTAVAAAAMAIVIWSRRLDWGQRHVLAAWGGYLLLTAATAYLAPTYQPAAPADALAGDIAVTVITLGLLGGACYRWRRR